MLIYFNLSYLFQYILGVFRLLEGYINLIFFMGKFADQWKVFFQPNICFYGSPAMQDIY